MANVHLLREFFVGRDPAIAENNALAPEFATLIMSTWSHDKLTKLRDGALEFVALIESEIQARISDDYDSRDHDYDGFRDDVEADADILRMAGMGTDEDYDGWCDDDWGKY